ncbi:MAG: hypothetical protein LBM39_02235 [Candidatus Methanoplasma sp.]|jgi:tetratricopeptide (TPR) repeat protein|nr:hypothetical protein [Candidatus Methanoplasma sp.]
MTDERILIITEGLKSLNNSAVDMISKGDYDSAAHLFETAEKTSDLFGYSEGVGMANLSLANLFVLKKDVLGALAYAVKAADILPPGEDKNTAKDMSRKLAISAVRLGIEKEDSGDFESALKAFEAAYPHVGDRAPMIADEISFIKSHLSKSE